MRERHVARLVRRNREREAAQPRLHRVFADGLDVDRDDACLVGARDPLVEAADVLHDLVSGSGRPSALRAASSRAADSDCGVTGTAGSVAPGRGFTAMPPPVSGRPGAAPPEAAGRSVVGATVFDASIAPESSPRELRDAPRQRRELHLLEERDQLLVLGLMHREVGERHFELHLVVERDELLRDARLLGVVDQRLPALLLLDLAGAREQRFEIADIRRSAARRSSRRCPARPARCRSKSPISACTSITFSGVHAELLDHLRDADLLVLHRVVHA